MKMNRFKIMNYRCISDSGWITPNDISVIVGKNESGKTSLLKALWKFNPYKEESYNLNREWPRGKRKSRSEDQVVSIVIFDFTEDEKEQLKNIDKSLKNVTSVRISKNYKGSYIYDFLPENPEKEHSLKWVISVIKEHLKELPDNLSDHFKNQYHPALANFIKQTRENGGADYAIAYAPTFKQSLQSFVHPNTQDTNNIQVLYKQIDAIVSELKTNPPYQKAIDTVHEWLPVFIYMDDYKAFQGSAHLNQVQQRKKQKNMTHEDNTIVMIMEMAGLDLDEEVRKATQEDKEQRMLDMNDASQTLTAEIAERWTSSRYEVDFNVDGYHFVTFVKGAEDRVLVPLEERSKGFQWFFSFDMTFMYETDGQFQNAIILLDEPGLHLHASAQKDLLNRMKSYAKNNQLIYTTHLPFMIDTDLTRSDIKIYVAELGKDGTKIHDDWATADEDARFTLQARMGLSWSDYLFIGKYNLVVEGVTDFWYLSTISSMVQEAGHDGLDNDLVIMPVGGGSKAAYISTILHGQNLFVAALLDSDQEGKTAYEQLVHQWILQDKEVLMIGNILGMEHPCSIEDLFDEDYYLQHVTKAYKKELKGQPLKLARTRQPIVDRVKDALQQIGIEHFNKGRVGKSIMKDLATIDITQVDAKTIKNFESVFNTINKVVNEWKSNNQ